MTDTNKSASESTNWRAEQSGSSDQAADNASPRGWQNLSGNWDTSDSNQNQNESDEFEQRGRTGSTRYGSSSYTVATNPNVSDDSNHQNVSNSSAIPSEQGDQNEQSESRTPTAFTAPGSRAEWETNTVSSESMVSADYGRSVRNGERGGWNTANEPRNNRLPRKSSGPNSPMVLKRPNSHNNSNQNGGRNQKGQNQRPSGGWAPQAWAEGSGWAGSRSAEVARTTKETSVKVILNLDGGELETVPELVGERTNKHAFQASTSQYVDIDTGIGFLDHMLHALAKHAGWSLYVKTKGDLYIDDHHTTEDTFLALGECVQKAMTWSPTAQLGLNRYGYAYAPLDEALSRAVVDLSARPYSVVELGFKREMIGQLSTEMITHAFQSFAQEARITLHVHCLHGDNDHHRAESAFKAVAVAMRMALSKRSGAGANEMQSTKGVLY